MSANTAYGTLRYRFRKVGAAYYLPVADGSTLWIKRGARTRRWELLHEFRDPMGLRQWAVLGIHSTLGAAQADACALLGLMA